MPKEWSTFMFSVTSPKTEIQKLAINSLCISAVTNVAKNIKVKHSFGIPEHSQSRKVKRETETVLAQIQ